MALSWTHEPGARWDAAKEQVVGGAPAGSLLLGRFRAGESVPGDWWRVDRDDHPVGYGWMDVGWEGAEVQLAVDPKEQGQGVGTFVLDHLESEAARQGLEYVYNAVPPGHPDPARVTSWLQARGFVTDGAGQLRRRVKKSDHPTPPSAVGSPP